MVERGVEPQLAVALVDATVFWCASPVGSCRWALWSASGPSTLVQSCTRCSSSQSSLASSSSEKFETMVNSSCLPRSRFFSVAYRTTCWTTGQLTSGSPPWNSMVTNGLVLCSTRSTARSAVSRVMSVWTASRLAREAWQ